MEQWHAVVARLEAAAAAAALHPPPDPVSSRHAAVLVGLFPGAAGEARVLLTLRSATLTSHQGEVCLPGGKRDPQDQDDLDTALREAEEELGLPRAEVRPLTRLPPLLSKHFLSVTPVLGLIPAGRQQHAPRPNPDEVAEVFDAPLDLFLSSKEHSSRDITWASRTASTPSSRAPSGCGASRQPSSYRAEHGVPQAAKLALGRDPDFQEQAPGGSAYSSLRYDGTQLCLLPSSPLHMGSAAPLTPNAQLPAEEATLEHQAGQPAAAQGRQSPAVRIASDLPEVRLNNVAGAVQTQPGGYGPGIAGSSFGSAAGTGVPCWPANRRHAAAPGVAVVRVGAVKSSQTPNLTRIAHEPDPCMCGNYELCDGLLRQEMHMCTGWGLRSVSANWPLCKLPCGGV
ncbi:NUDIX hydrolase domain-like protein [Haematococcus lacustris]